MLRWRRLVRNYETRIDVSKAMIHSALGSLLLRRISHLANFQTDSKLDFAHFGEALSLSQARVQKIRSCSMTRRASSSGRTVRPKGPVDAHFSFHEDQ